MWVNRHGERDATGGIHRSSPSNRIVGTPCAEMVDQFVAAEISPVHTQCDRV
jgi:hypothetical protein